MPINKKEICETDLLWVLYPFFPSNTSGQHIFRQLLALTLRKLSTPLSKINLGTLEFKHSVNLNTWEFVRVNLYRSCQHVSLSFTKKNVLTWRSAQMAASKTKLKWNRKFCNFRQSEIKFPLPSSSTTKVDEITEPKRSVRCAEIYFAWPIALQNGQNFYLRIKCVS